MKRYEYDAFLSFAVEDKENVATPLFEALEAKGLDVWYSGREFKLGVSIQDQIREGLDKSHFGILLISPHYFETNWTQKELGALWAREREGHQIIIPVFHNISPESVGERDPHLAERWSVLTNQGLNKAADRIHTHIRQSEAPNTSKKLLFRNPLVYTLLVLTLLLVTVSWWQSATGHVAQEEIDQAITTRISEFHHQIDLDWQSTEQDADFIPATTTTIIEQHARFDAIDANFRNYYQFSNGISSWQFLKNVAPASGIDFDKWTAKDDYGFTYPKSIMSAKDVYNAFDLKVQYLNTQPINYDIETIKREEGSLKVTVAYENPIRLVVFHYEFGRWTSYRKHTTYSIRGLKPTEQYHFQLRAGTWQLQHIE